MFKYFFALSFLLVLNTSAFAASSTKEHTGWYVGGGLGYFDVNAKEKVSRPLLVDDQASTASIEVYGGYNFTEYFGLEISLIDSGDVAENSGYDAYFLPIMFTPKFTWQINDTVSLYGKLGLTLGTYIMQDDAFWSDDNIVWSGIGGVAGIGTNISLTRLLNLRISYDYTQTRMRSDTDDIGYFRYGYLFFMPVEDIDVKSSRFSAGVYVQF